MHLFIPLSIFFFLKHLFALDVNLGQNFIEYEEGARSSGGCTYVPSNVGSMNLNGKHYTTLSLGRNMTDLDYNKYFCSGIFSIYKENEPIIQILEDEVEINFDILLYDFPVNSRLTLYLQHEQGECTRLGDPDDFRLFITIDKFLDWNEHVIAGTTEMLFIPDYCNNEVEYYTKASTKFEIFRTDDPNEMKNFTFEGQFTIHWKVRMNKMFMSLSSKDYYFESDVLQYEAKGAVQFGYQFCTTC